MSFCFPPPHIFPGQCFCSFRPVPFFPLFMKALTFRRVKGTGMLLSFHIFLLPLMNTVHSSDIFLKFFLCHMLISLIPLHIFVPLFTCVYPGTSTSCFYPNIIVWYFVLSVCVFIPFIILKGHVKGWVSQPAENYSFSHSNSMLSSCRALWEDICYLEALPEQSCAEGWLAPHSRWWYAHKVTGWTIFRNYKLWTL